MPRKTPEEKKMEAETKAARALDKASKAMKDLLAACRKCGEPEGEKGQDSRVRLIDSMNHHADFLWMRLGKL